MKPHVVFVAVPGATLMGNPLGDPATRYVPVYLPPSYDGTKRFPANRITASLISN